MSPGRTETARKVIHPQDYPTLPSRGSRKFGRYPFDGTMRLADRNEPQPALDADAQAAWNHPDPTPSMAYMVRSTCQGAVSVNGAGQLQAYIRPLDGSVRSRALMDFAHTSLNNRAVSKTSPLTRLWACRVDLSAITSTSPCATWRMGLPDFMRLSVLQRSSASSASVVFVGTAKGWPGPRRDCETS